MQNRHEITLIINEIPYPETSLQLYKFLTETLVKMGMPDHGFNDQHFFDEMVKNSYDSFTALSKKGLIRHELGYYYYDSRLDETSCYTKTNLIPARSQIKLLIEKKENKVVIKLKDNGQGFLHYGKGDKIEITRIARYPKARSGDFFGGEGVGLTSTVFTLERKYSVDVELKNRKLDGATIQMFFHGKVEPKQVTQYDSLLVKTPAEERTKIEIKNCFPCVLF